MADSCPFVVVSVVGVDCINPIETSSGLIYEPKVFVYHAVTLSKYPVKYKANERIINKTTTTLNTNHIEENAESFVSVEFDGASPDASAFDVDEEKEMGKDVSLVLSSLFLAL